MLYSYTKAPKDLPVDALAFLNAAQETHSPTGMVLSQEALDAYLKDTSLDKEIASLVAAVDDEESQKRVDEEIKRRVVTGKLSGETADAIKEAVEILGLHKQDFTVADIPLIVVLYTDKPLEQQPVILNITGTKSLADAIRQLWSKLYVSPYEESVLSAVMIMRMPPAHTTARVIREGKHYLVQATEGLGLLVGEAPHTDTFLFGAKDVLLENKTVSVQTHTIVRNDRTGQIVKTATADGSSQKITDVQARQLCLAAKKTGLQDAIFGVTGEKHWLLRIPQHERQHVEEPELVAEDPTPTEPVEEAQPAPDTPEPAEEEVSPLLSEEIEVVELPEEQEPAVDADEQYAEQEEVPADVEEELAAYQKRAADVDEPDEQYADDETGEEPVVEDQADGEEEETSAYTYQQMKQLTTGVLMQALKTIELTMREWLYEKDQPKDFGDLVTMVARKRKIPQKTNILLLYERKKAAAFEDPEPETVRFALDTVEAFLREF